MAFAKGRQAAEETAKAECLRRWPELKLKCKARYYHGRCEGYIVEREREGKARRVMVSGEHSASEAWRTALAVLEGQEKDNAA